MSSTITLTQQSDSLADKAATLHLRGGDEGDKESDKTVLAAPGDDYTYKHLLPTFDHSVKYPPLEPFEHVDPGHAALSDPTPRSFLAGAKESHLTPKFGSEIEGVQLSKLDARAKR